LLCRFERALELACLRNEPIALNDAVVHRSVGVCVGRKRLVEGVECRRAIALMAVGLQQGVVLRVSQRDAAAVMQCDDGMLDVGIREHRMDVVGHVAKPA